MISKGKDVYYYAQLAKLSTILKQASYLEDNDDYISFAENVFKQIPTIIDDTDLKKMKLPTQYDFVMNYIVYSMEGEKAINYEVMFSLLERTIDNITRRNDENNWFYNDIPDLVYLFVLLADYKAVRKAVNTDFHKRLRKEPVPPGIARRIYKDYQDRRKKDKLAKHLRDSWIYSVIGTALGTLLKYILFPVFWISKMLFQKKIHRRISFSVLAIVVIMLTTFHYSDQLTSTWQSVSSHLTSEAEQPSKEPTYLTITTDGANIRKKANLHADVVTIVSPGTKLEYRGIKKTDNSNVKWYQIKTPNDKKGWISSKIVE